MGEVLYRLEVESLDLGPDVRAVGLELVDAETLEPVTGEEAAHIWAAILASLVGEEPWALDFFSHLERVRDFCRHRGIAWREPNAHALVIGQQAAEPLGALFERFANETFGVRAGGPALSGDATMEGSLACHGVDAYHAAFPKYLFCAVCDFENGFLTLLSDRLWASEVIRRSRTALDGLRVDVTRPGLSPVGACLTPDKRN